MPPRSCSCDCSCSGSGTLFELLRRPPPSCPQTSPELWSDEQARAYTATDGSALRSSAGKPRAPSDKLSVSSVPRTRSRPLPQSLSQRQCRSQSHSRPQSRGAGGHPSPSPRSLSLPGLFLLPVPPHAPAPAPSHSPPPPRLQTSRTRKSCQEARWCAATADSAELRGNAERQR